MTMKSVLIAGVAAIAISTGAQAQDYEGLYGTIGAGLTSVAPDRDLESFAVGITPFDSEVDYDNGIGVYSALGYDWGNSWRTELEFSYRNNDARHIAPDNLGFSGFPENTLDGDLKSYSLLANILYDLDYVTESAGLPFPVTPFIGGGVGATNLSLELNGNNPAALGGLTPIVIDSDQLTLAYQGIAGVAIGLADNLSLDLSYRYFGALKRGFDGQFAGQNQNIRTTPDSHNLFAGLRFNFGAPAAAVAAPVAAIQYRDCWDGSSVPVSASCPPQIDDEPVDSPDPIQVTVYFDYDKSNLTPEASSLINEAVRRAEAFDVRQVRVVGNTDTSGSSAYNQALSERRARVVRDALISRGIDASAISLNALGETNLAKPTPDGTREPLNRRSDITIEFVE